MSTRRDNTVTTSSSKDVRGCPFYLPPVGRAAPPPGEVRWMWLEMLKGWVDLAREVAILLAAIALVAFSALATYTMLTRGMNG